MNYHTVEINGKEHAVSFGNGTLLRFERKTGINALELGDHLTYSTIIELVHAGLVVGARKAGVEFDLNIEEMCDLLDEDPEALGRIMNTYEQSMPQGGGKKKRQPAKR